MIGIHSGLRPIMLTGVGIVLFLFSVNTARCQSMPPEVAEGIMAVVADKIILKSEIESEYSNWLGQDNLPDPRMK